MGKREVNQLSTVDVVINILIANVAAGGIVEEQYWLDALGGVLVIVALQIIMAKIQINHPTHVMLLKANHRWSLKMEASITVN